MLLQYIIMIVLIIFMIFNCLLWL